MCRWWIRNKKTNLKSSFALYYRNKALLKTLIILVVITIICWSSAINVIIHIVIIHLLIFHFVIIQFVILHFVTTIIWWSSTLWSLTWWQKFTAHSLVLCSPAKIIVRMVIFHGGPKGKYIMILITMWWYLNDDKKSDAHPFHLLLNGRHGEGGLCHFRWLHPPPELSSLRYGESHQ